MTKSDRIARFEAALQHLPLVAILRGIKPSEAEAIGAVLYRSGFRLIEVPLNSPEPFTSIATLRRVLPADVVIGAGTVIKTDAVDRLAAIDADLVVMPHGDLGVIRAAKASGLICMPGVATPTEAFAALEAGADALKLFPAELIAPNVVKALRAVLPRTTRLFPVGGITPQSFKPYVDAGVAGFGLGSALYAPGTTADEIAVRAERFVAAWQEFRPAN